MGTVLFPFLVNMLIQSRWLFVNEHALLLFQGRIFFLFPWEVEYHIIRCELIGGGSLRDLRTFFLICLLLLYTTHTCQRMLCIAAIVVCTHAHHVVHYKIIRAYHILLLFWLHPNRSATASYGHGNITQETTTADILIDDQLQPHVDMVTVD